jgi:hypothetical protein
MTFKEPVPREYAEKLRKVLGKPACETRGLMIWTKLHAPYVDIKIMDEYIPHNFPAAHHDFVYSTISLKRYGHLDPKKACALLRVSGSIIVDLLKQEASARCGGLTKNDVTLSFVIDVIQNKTPATKREYKKRILNNIVTHRQLDYHKKL